MNDMATRPTQNTTAPSKFDPLEIGWKGQTYVVDSTRCFELLGRLEEIIAPQGGAVDVFNALGKPHELHLTVTAKAFATALRFAGAPVTNEEVYLSLSRGVARGGPEGYTAILDLSLGLNRMFFPFDLTDEDLFDEAQAAGNPEADAVDPEASSEPVMS